MLKDYGGAIDQTGRKFRKEHSIWNKTAKYGLGVLTFAALLGGCGGGGGGSDAAAPPTNEQPNEQTLLVDSPQSLAQAISFQGGQLVEGDIPAPADASGGTISVTPEIAVTAGGDTQFSAQADVPDGYYVHAYLVQLEGSSSTFVIPVDANGQPASGSQQKLRVASDLRAATGTLAPRNAAVQAPATTGRTQLSCTGHPNLTFNAGAGVDGSAPSYSAPATVVAYVQADVPPFTPPQITIPSMSRSREHWTQPTQVTVKAVQVGTGEFQITLTWDSTADVDLHLEEPGGHNIHYASRNSAMGDGYLDVDDVDGYGPENIFFDTGLPAGNYTAKVHMYSADEGALPTNYTVTIKNNGSVESYSGTLTAIDETDIVTQLTQSDTGSGGGDGSGDGDTGGSEVLLEEQLLEGDEFSKQVFFVQMPAGKTRLVVTLNEATDGRQQADLFVRAGSEADIVNWDTNQQYSWTADCASVNPNREQEVCELSGLSGGVYITVYGYHEYWGVNLVAEAF